MGKLRLAFIVTCTCASLGSTLAEAQTCTPAWSKDVAPMGAGGVVSALTEGSVGGAERLYAAGGFLTIHGVSATRIAQWDGANWSALGAGLDSLGLALATYDEGAGERLFVGGAFTKAGNIQMSRLARWDGAAWTSVAGGVTGTGSAVRALHVHDDGAGESLFVGGFFTSAGGVSAKNIARWDGTQFHALGPGLNGTVRALVTHNDGSGPALYAAGDFTHTGDGMTALDRIARWDGAMWTPVGSGMDGSVMSLASGSVGGADRLVAGGTFANAGGGAASNVASWDGSAWSPLNGGVNASVGAMAVEDGTLYLAGQFQFVDGVNMRGVATWDGSAYLPMGTGLNTGSPNGMAFHRSALAGDALVLGGSFSSAGGVSVSNIAQWNLCTGGGIGPDMNGDGAVDGEDLAALLASWGVGGGGGPADFDASGSVDGSDLASLLAAWTG